MKYEHEVIRDLMPLCMDGIASPQSQKAVQAHLTECADCAKEWEMMKNGIQTYESTPLPEDTPKYAETAKRVRRHNRWMLLRVTCVLVLILFAAIITANYRNGARFTAHSAAEYWMREHRYASFFATPEEWRAAGKAKYTYLGAVKSPDGKACHEYALIETADGSLKALCASDVERGEDVLSLGMWSGGSGMNSILTESAAAVYMVESGSTYGYNYNNHKSMASVCIYSTDVRVETIEIVLDGKPTAFTLNDKGFAAVLREDYSIHADWREEDQSIKEGSALDASGNVLYTLEPVTEDGWTHYEWLSAE